jgi:hypothetical protein
MNLSALLRKTKTKKRAAQIGLLFMRNALFLSCYLLLIAAA